MYHMRVCVYMNGSVVHNRLGKWRTDGSWRQPQYMICIQSVRSEMICRYLHGHMAWWWWLSNCIRSNEFMVFSFYFFAVAIIFNTPPDLVSLLYCIVMRVSGWDILSAYNSSILSCTKKLEKYSKVLPCRLRNII